MSDNITLPREVVEKAVKAFENGCPPTCENGMIDSGGFLPWGEPMLDLCPACLAFEHLRTALAAEQPKHPGYVIGSHWLETAYSRICAGEAEADVLRDCGWERVDDAEALRRENERLREALTYDWDQLEACRESLREHMVEIKRLREAVEAYIRAKDSDGGGKGGFFPKPPTVAHQRRVHLAWQELNAALRREDV